MPNVDIREFDAKTYEAGSWMDIILCPKKEVPWPTTKCDILMKDFKAKSMLWLNIIYSRLSPCTHIAVVTDMRARMVACILSGISMNVDEIALSERWHFKNHGGTHIQFRSLNTELCRKEEVEEYVIETCVYPSSLIYPLKFKGEGATR